MSLLGFFARWRKEPRLVELGDSIAAESLESVWPLVGHRVGELSTHELVGYVRARSRGLVSEKVQRVAETHGSGIAQHTEALIEQSTNALVKLVVTRYRQSTERQVMRRRAA
ncbi:MAG: hypothetical protein U1A77_15150 [Pirellulales bacterium]